MKDVSFPLCCHSFNPVPSTERVALGHEMRRQRDGGGRVPEKFQPSASQVCLGHGTPGNNNTCTAQWGMTEGICASGIGSLWPKVTTRGLQTNQSVPGPWRALGTESSKAHGAHWAGKLCSDPQKFGIRAGSSQNKNKWLIMNCEFFLKSSNSENHLRDLFSLGPWELFQATIPSYPSDSTSSIPSV